MTDNQLAKELHELKRRRETPLPLTEMFDELLSLAPGLSAKQKRKRSDEIMATALNGWSARTPDRNRRLAGAPADSPLSVANILAGEHLRPFAGRSQTR
jgi:hypothetical protein